MTDDLTALSTAGETWLNAFDVRYDTEIASWANGHRRQPQRMTHPTSGDSSQGQPLFEEATGETFRAQTSFDENLSRRASDSSYTFRQRLQQIDGAIEE